MKKGVLILPLTILLTSCGTFKFGYTNDQHSAGIPGGNTASNNNYTESYTYFAGDTIDTEGKNVANITFEINESASDIGVEKINSLLRCDVADLFAGTLDSFNVGTKEGAWLFIGAKTSYSDGFLVLSFNQAIKDVLIQATPYYYEDTTWNDYEIVKDDNVCVAVDNSGYVKLSSALNEEQNAINTTDCRYHFEQPQTEFKIKVGGEKAFIKKIVLYY